MKDAEHFLHLHGLHDTSAYITYIIRCYLYHRQRSISSIFLVPFMYSCWEYILHEVNLYPHQKEKAVAIEGNL